MQHFKSSIALTKLSDVEIQAKPDGSHQLVIPIEANDLFISEKGAVYLNCVCFENRIPDQWGCSHTIKQSFQMGDPRSKTAPTIGTLKPLVPRNQAPQMPYQAKSAGWSAPQQ